MEVERNQGDKLLLVGARRFLPELGSLGGQGESDVAGGAFVLVGWEASNFPEGRFEVFSDCTGNFRSDVSPSVSTQLHRPFSYGVQAFVPHGFTPTTSCSRLVLENFDVLAEQIDKETDVAAYEAGGLRVGDQRSIVSMQAQTGRNRLPLSLVRLLVIAHARFRKALHPIDWTVVAMGSCASQVTGHPYLRTGTQDKRN